MKGQGAMLGVVTLTLSAPASQDIKSVMKLIGNTLHFIRNASPNQVFTPGTRGFRISGLMFTFVNIFGTIYEESHNFEGGYVVFGNIMIVQLYYLRFTARATGS